VEDDTMDRAEPRRPLDGASTPHEATAGDPGEPDWGPDDWRALPDPDPDPDPEPPLRPRGRHEAQRRRVGGPAGAAIAIVVAAVVLAVVLATRLIGSAEEVPQASVASQAAPATQVAGPTSRPPGAGSFGNLVVNWSFEQDLNGWQVLGAADAGREPQGRTSGSSASVRGRGPQPARIGLALPKVVPAARRGERYVASAWVRSTAPGQEVTIRLVGPGGRESSQAATSTLPGLAWKRAIVDHTVAGASELRLEVVADGLPAGDTLLVDEVVVRQG
jgi:hypothetical protein